MSEQESEAKAHSTLYVNNINDTISKSKISYVLNRLFGRYGSVAEIRLRKSLKMKGQAFVTYKDKESCDKALAKLQGRPVFKKPIKITHAKAASDAYLLLVGDIELLDKREEQRKRRKDEAALATSKRTKTPSSKTPEITDSQLKLWKLLPPNKVLLLQNLTAEHLDSTLMEAVFEKYDGFERIRLIKFRKLAFIDFELEAQATLCLSKIDVTEFGSKSLLTYAKK